MTHLGDGVLLLTNIQTWTLQDNVYMSCLQQWHTQCYK